MSIHKYRYRERDADRCSVTRNTILFIWVKVNDSKCRFVEDEDDVGALW